MPLHTFLVQMDQHYDIKDLSGQNIREGQCINAQKVNEMGKYQQDYAIWGYQPVG